jgi:hypothetical protein
MKRRQTWFRFFKALRASEFLLKEKPTPKG